MRHRATVEPAVLELVGLVLGVPTGQLLRPALLLDGVTVGRFPVLPDFAYGLPRPFQRVSWAALVGKIPAMSM